MRRFHPARLVLAVSILAACGEVTTSTDSSTPLMAHGGADEAVIVVFNSNVTNPRALAQQLAAAGGGALSFTYEHAIKGFAASFPTAALDGLRRNPNVAYIEPDGVVTTMTTNQSPATWGLDRIDQGDLPLSNSYTYAADGTGVRVYIIDTGIRFTHSEFGGRAVTGYDAVTNGGNASDCNGHGTHVAGTVGGSTYGVAKNVTLYAVRVLNCAGSGSWSGVIAGVDFVTGEKQANSTIPMAANMSLGGGKNDALNDAVAASIAAGVTYAVAAGNENTNACTRSPASTPSALTVGATTSADARSSFSNWGTCVDLFAPGSSITSAWKNNDNSTNTISGTSMASPHVAGVAALVLQGNPTWSASQVTSAIINKTTPNKVTNPGTGSPNKLLFSDFAATVGTPTNVAPTASINAPDCTLLTCTFDASGSGDSDGTITSYAWGFDDPTSNSNSATGVSASHTFSAAGTYTVALTVTDDDGATGQATRNVTVTTGSGGPDAFVLSVSIRTNKKWNFADLVWSGSTAASVDVYRGSNRIATTANGGSYTDQFSGQSGDFVYKVCNAGTTVCSNEFTVSF